MQESLDMLVNRTHAEVANAVINTTEIKSALIWHRLDALRSRAKFVRDNTIDKGTRYLGKMLDEEILKLQDLLDKHPQFKKNNKVQGTFVWEIFEKIANIAKAGERDFEKKDPTLVFAEARRVIREISWHCEDNPSYHRKIRDHFFVALSKAMLPAEPAQNEMFNELGYRRLSTGLLIGLLLTELTFS
jgi:hypothetical protein